MPADSSSASTKLFGRQRDIHALLGSGKGGMRGRGLDGMPYPVANVLLWRDKRLSGTIFVGVTAVWLLFSVAEYNLLTFLCHLSIAAMLVVFIWANIAKLLGTNLPEIPEQVLSKNAFREAAVAFHAELGDLLSFLHRIARGEDLRLFLLVPMIFDPGSFSAPIFLAQYSCRNLSLNRDMAGYLCMQTLPFLYEKYEDEIDRLATQGGTDFQKLYKKLDAGVLSRIPRGPGAPLKDKKMM
ncbi:hypothetical protein Taro_029543 [Colocasia esculenta]|uniref:Reticulon-like protein n=1 Tax=Colocasia esculenta TaxID=4460 RepID=A0A843VXH5_COLES|nr:hypothetical protein [Colocasia esculenta]